MKNFLLSSLLVAGIIGSANAQTQFKITSGPCSPTGVGYTYFFDDFESSTELMHPYEPSGVYIWGEDTLTGVGSINDGFQALVNRDNSTFEAVVTQAQAEYVPFGISFGDDGGTINTLDLSWDAWSDGGAYFRMALTNNSATDIIFRISLQDTNGVTADTYAAASADVGGFANAYMYSSSINIAAGESVYFMEDLSDGVYANYGTNTFDTVDFTQIKGVNFTVINQLNTGAPDYNPLAIANVGISIDNLQVGWRMCSGLNDNIIDLVDISPNPFNNFVTVTTGGPMIKGYQILNLNGQVVQSGNNIDAGSYRIDTGNLDAGMYFVKVVNVDDFVDIKRIIKL